MGKDQTRCPTAFHPGSPAVSSIQYMNDLSKFTNNKSTAILFADDTSILFTHSNTTKFNANTHTVFETINTWFKHNYLS